MPKQRIERTTSQQAGTHPYVVVLSLLFVASVAVSFRRVGRWLIREDSLRTSDIIVVLSGSMPLRAEEAARLFLMGYAPKVWISRPESVATEPGTTGESEALYNRDALIQFGVPASAIWIFPEPIVNTKQEIEEISRQMTMAGKHRAIIVTSPQHTRRVRTLWGRLADHRLEMSVHAAWQDSFDADHWWRNAQNARAVRRELMGLLNAWLGFPVRSRAPDKN